MITLPATTRNIEEMCSSQCSKRKKNHQKCFLKILSSNTLLRRQDLTLQGSVDESNSKFVQIFKLCSEDGPILLEWFVHKTDKYTSGGMQNKILAVMADQVLAKIDLHLHDIPFYTIMADETTDASNQV